MTKSRAINCIYKAKYFSQINSSFRYVLLCYRQKHLHVTALSDIPKGRVS